MRDNLLDNRNEYSATTSKIHNAASLSDLEAVVDKINKAPGKSIYAYLDSNAFEQMVEEWRAGRSLDDLWREQDHYPDPVHFDELDIVPSLLAIDLTKVLSCLDRFRFPHPIRQILARSTFLDDREKIEAALKVAPICSEDGRCWNGSLLAFLLLKTAEAHCQQLWEDVQRAGEFDKGKAAEPDAVQATLSTWIEKLGGIVMARPDGRFLGVQWLLMKVRDERGERAHQPQPKYRLRQADLIWWIASGLSKAGLVSADIEALGKLSDTPIAEGEASGDESPPRLGALAMMELIDRLRDEESGDGEKLLRRLDVLLVNRDPGFKAESFFDSTSSLPATCCAYLLANTQNPSERWRRSWDKLIEQRRRTQHWLQTRDSDAFAPSLFLLTVGIAGVDWLCSKPHERFDIAEKLWREVFNAALACWLTISLEHLATGVGTRIGWLFARHHFVFGNADTVGSGDGAGSASTNSDYSELLAKDLARLGGDDLMVATCCNLASLNGVTPEHLTAALKCDLGRLNAVLDQFIQWQELERPERQRQELVDALKKCTGR